MTKLDIKALAFILGAVFSLVLGLSEQSKILCFASFLLASYAIILLFSQAYDQAHN